MQYFKNFPGEHTSDPPKFLFFNLLELALLKKLRLKKMVKLCSSLLLRFLATPLRHPMNNKYHFRDISLVIWVQNSGKIVDKNIPPVKIFYCAHCLRLRDVKTFSFLESQILVPRGPASYLCSGARIFSRRPCVIDPTLVITSTLHYFSPTRTNTINSVWK